MNDILQRYGELLNEVDRWFSGCLSRHHDRIACARGCSACCRGLFDITVLDALYLKRGFDRLSLQEKERIQQRGATRLAGLNARYPGFASPWILNGVPEAGWDRIMPEDDQERCVLLSDAGTCLVYDHRPMTCRLNGIPQIEVDGEWLSDEWCSLNFTEKDPGKIEDLRYPFRDVFAQELLLFREITSRLFGRPFNELDTIIPAALFLDGSMIEVTRGVLTEGADQSAATTKHPLKPERS